MTTSVENPSADLRFPTGRFQRPASLDVDARARAIDIIAATPAHLRDAVHDLRDEQIDTEYRPGGWTVRQVVHHLPDSHVNAYIRFKLALTENEPTIKPYDEGRWAEMVDSTSVPVATSLAMLDAVHERWVAILRALSASDFERMLIHPETGRQRLDQMLALYAWHGSHHVAHITTLRERMGW